MNGYEKRTLKKRRDIIEAAQELLLAFGITGVSIEQIAEKARVSRVTLFKYFGDKENLVKEAVLIWVNALMQEYDRILEGNQPFHTKLVSILNLIIAGIHSAEDDAIKISVRGNVELMSIIKEQVAILGLPKIMTLIEDGKRAGEIESSLDNEAILTFFSMFSPIISDPNYIRKEKSYQKSLFDLFMGGLIKDWYEIKNG